MRGKIGMAEPLGEARCRCDAGALPELIALVENSRAGRGRGERMVEGRKRGGGIVLDIEVRNA